MHSHDVGRVLVIPSRSSFILKGSNAVAKKISPNHFNGEAGSLEAEDLGHGSCELLVICIKVAPVLAVLHLYCSGL